MEVKDYRIVGTRSYSTEEDLFLCTIELLSPDSEEHRFVSLEVIDDSYAWRVDDYDHCEALMAYWDEKGEFPEDDGMENYDCIEETEESSYRIFFCMINSMWDAVNTTYHVVK